MSTENINEIRDMVETYHKVSMALVDDKYKATLDHLYEDMRSRLQSMWMDEYLSKDIDLGPTVGWDHDDTIYLTDVGHGEAAIDLGLDLVDTVTISINGEDDK